MTKTRIDELSKEIDNWTEFEIITIDLLEEDLTIFKNIALENNISLERYLQCILLDEFKKEILKND